MRNARCEAIARAVAAVGNVRRVSDMLSVPLEEVKAWLEGKGRPPVSVFLTAVDIIDDHAERRGAGVLRGIKN